jgi:endonuclease YncB( thermonuclease family)
MSAPYLFAFSGSFVIVGKEPDGDSVRFVPDQPQYFRVLQHGYRLKPSLDGSVQLRFEGIDAPELHYDNFRQPQAVESRDCLLEWLGYENIRYEKDSWRVVSATPGVVRGTIFTRSVDKNGRPISFVLAGDKLPSVRYHDWNLVDEKLIDQSLNGRLLAAGLAYLLIYTSTAYTHREYLRQIARTAREAGLGIWPHDSTNSFRLRNHNSVGESGQLILPKIFRRCNDFLSDAQHGFRGNLDEWLRRSGHNENDRVVFDERIEVSLSDLIEQRNSYVVFQADLLDIYFVEK